MKLFVDISTPIGPLRLLRDEAGLREILFSNRPWPSPDPEVARPSNEEPFREVIGQLGEYFAGTRRKFELDLAPVGTPFQTEVWDLLRTIPYGATSTYGEIANRLGRPEASRAVGAANGRNPIPIVIPCHRVIGANGSLTGFGGGLTIKRRLLALESGQREVFRSEEAWQRTAAGSPSPR